MFNHYEYFEAIVQHESLSKAAKSLGISQPALSGYLNKLEDKLGFPLFNRSKTPVTFTEAGKIYYKYLRRSLALKNNFSNEISDLNSLTSGKIVMAGAGSVTSCYLQKVTADFLNKYPNVKIKIIEGVVSDIAKRASNEEIDFFITPNKTNEETFAYIPLFFERILLCIPESSAINEIPSIKDRRIQLKRDENSLSILNHPEPIDGTLLKNERFILCEKGSNARMVSEKFFSRYNITPNNPIEVRQPMTGFNLSSNGAGISFIPESMLKFGNFNNIPYVYAIDEGVSSREMYVCYKKDKYMSSASLSYIEMLKEYLQSN